MNIFGEGEKKGLTNPLTEDLLANNFNGLNFTELHTDEIHNNSGTGNILVHEKLNMTNKRIANMADPTQAKDAVTLGYLQSNPPAVTIPYDMSMAFSGNDALIPVGNLVPFYYVPRPFTGNSVVAFLRVAPSDAPMTFRVYVGSIIVADLVFATGQMQSSTQSPWLNISDTILNERIFVENITSTGTDSTAKGLLVNFTGIVI